MSEYINPAIVADKDCEIEELRRQCAALGQEVVVLRQFIADLVTKSSEVEICPPTIPTPRNP